MRVSGGCGDMRVVQRRLQEAPPAVWTVQLRCESSRPSSNAIQHTLEGIDMVRFSLHAVCSNTQSGPLQCPRLSTGCTCNRVKQSDAACAHTCACCGPHTNPVCRIRPKLQRPGYVAVSTSTVIPACTSSCFRRSQWMSVSPRPVGLAASAYTAFRIC